VLSLFLDTAASDRSEYPVNVNFGFLKENEVSFLYTMITEWMPDYCQVFRAIPPVSDWESGLGDFKLDVSEKTKQSSFYSDSDTSSDLESLKAGTLTTPTGVEVHMCVPGGEEGVLAFIRALEDCLKEYGVEFGEERGGILYYKLHSTY
jgi:hypothetical protein